MPLHRLPQDQVTSHGRVVLCLRILTKVPSGSTYSTNLAVAEEDFKVSGSPKSISKKADGGNTITSYFCGDCGSTLFRAGDTFKGMRIVKAGVMDDYSALNEAQPGVELFTEHRVKWVPQVPGTDEKKGMGS